MSSVRRLARLFAPRTDGRAELACLETPAEVVRDRFGFAHVYAASLPDALRAQGYVHAQDRPFQMEMIRRLGAGRLAELAGVRMLELDRFVRRLRLRWAADRAAAALDAESRALVTAYCEGVNWEAELVRMRMASRLGEERARRLDPSFTEHPPAIVPGRLVAEAEKGSARLRRLIGHGASNNWAVAGTRTESGKPLLANDPHLHLAMPVLWHVQHLSWDGQTVAGFTIPGIPLVVLGRNEHVAWGATAALLDTQDLFVERFEAGRYEADGAWVEAEVVREEIAVRGRREPVVEEVVVTRHGPVVAGPEPGSGEALALAWSAYEPGNTVGSLIGLARAHDVDEAERALELYAGPPLNFVLADDGGAVGYKAAGGPVPVRRNGEGLVPAPGWDSSHEWVGWIPPSELPRLRDPERGFVATANNRVVGDGYPHVLRQEHMNGYRAQRIESLLGSLDKVTVEDCRRIQLDLVSLPGLELAEIARVFEADDPLERRALELLAGWDGDYGAAGAAGAVFGVLMRRLQQETYSELGDDLDYFLGRGRSEATAAFGLYERTRPHVLELLRSRDDSFFADGRTWDGVFRAALAGSVRDLGPDPERWRWGALHEVLFEHPFNEPPGLGRIFSRGPYPVGGDTDTIWQMAWPVEKPYGPQCIGPSFPGGLRPRRPRREPGRPRDRPVGPPREPALRRLRRALAARRARAARADARSPR